MRGILLYQLYDLQHAALYPARLLAEATQNAFQNPFSPASYTRLGRTIAAGAELFERTTRRFGKPAFGLSVTRVNGDDVAVREVPVLPKPFCNLVHFERATDEVHPTVLVVAPMSGHYATLLRGTVEALLPEHDVYITDWLDARTVPLSRGSFDLEDYITYVMEFLGHLGPHTHVIAVCQPTVPVLCAVSLMAQNNDPNQPATMVLMGGPIDTTAAPTVVTNWRPQAAGMVRAHRHPVGAGLLSRRLPPGLSRLHPADRFHVDEPRPARGRSREAVRTPGHGGWRQCRPAPQFYDEYPLRHGHAGRVFPANRLHRFPAARAASRNHDMEGPEVDPSAIRHTALLTVEGEMDDISAPGQTRAAHRSCANIPAEKRGDHLQKGVGHYGIFNGRRWREQILPRVRDFILTHDTSGRFEAPVAPSVAAE